MSPVTVTAEGGASGFA